MHCVLVEPHLAAYVDGELDAATRDEVERHLLECRRCREAVRDMRVSCAVLAQWRSPRRKTSLADTLIPRVRAEAPAPAEAGASLQAPRRVRTWTRRPLAVAALLSAATATWFVLDGVSAPKGPPIFRPVAALGRAADDVERPADLGHSRFVLDALVGDAWASRRPDAGTIIQLEVAATLAADTDDARRARVVGDVLKRLGQGSRAARGSPLGGVLAATGEWLGAMLASGSAWADEPPRDLGALLDEAVKLEADGDLESAVGKYRLAAGDRVLALRANILQANVEMKLGRAESAVASLDRAMALTKPETFYRELVTELRGRATEAVELKKKIAELETKLIVAEQDFDVLSDIGGLQVKAGDLKGAEETFGRLAREEGEGREKDVLRARLVGAWCRRGLNRTGEAFEEFDRLIADAREIYPEASMLAQFERAKTLQLAGRTSQALDDYRDLAANVALAPAALAAVQFQIGFVLLTDLARPEEALAVFRSLDREGVRDEPYARAALALAKDAEPAAK